MTNKVGSPTSKVDDLTPEQRRALLEQLLREKAKRMEALPAPSAPQLFAERVYQQPGLTAIVGDGIEITYRELNDRANRLANFLQRQDLGSGSLIAIGVTGSVDLIVGVLGILKAGYACLPIDPRHPRVWTDHVLSAARPDLL
ncbi:MAG: AMP-binding protein, partial [Acidobacteriota bacterium]